MEYRGDRYDVVVVGGRVAGASLAMLLARAGHRVAIVDRARLPSDTLSTHNIWQGGSIQLRRWGLLEKVIATGAPASTEVHNTVDGACEEDSTRTAPFVLDADEPPVLLGTDRGANPVEYVLHALAACVTTSTVYHAAAQGIEIEAVESSLEGDLDLQGFLGLKEDVRRGFQKIHINFKVKGDASEEQLRALSQMSPVLDIVTNPVPVEIHIEQESPSR